MQGRKSALVLYPGITQLIRSFSSRLLPGIARKSCTEHYWSWKGENSKISISFLLSEYHFCIVAKLVD